MWQEEILVAATEALAAATATLHIRPDGASEKNSGSMSLLPVRLEGEEGDRAAEAQARYRWSVQAKQASKNKYSNDRYITIL